MYHRLLSNLPACPRLKAGIETHQYTVEQILDVLVPEMVKQLMEVPKIISPNRVQQQTLQQIVETPVPQVVEELSEASKVFSQDSVQQRFGGQIIEPPALSLTENVVEMPACQARCQYNQSGEAKDRQADSAETCLSGEDQPGDHAHLGSAVPERGC